MTIINYIFIYIDLKVRVYRTVYIIITKCTAYGMFLFNYQLILNKGILNLNIHLRNNMTKNYCSPKV